MVFGLSPLCSASIIFANSILGKSYMTSWRLGNPDGEVGNPKFDNARKAQLNEAEWSPLLMAGLMIMHVRGDKAPCIAAGLAAFGSVWYACAHADSLLLASVHMPYFNPPSLIMPMLPMLRRRSRYLWSRIILQEINGAPTVLPGGLSRYFAGLMISAKLLMTITSCPALQ